MFLDNISLGGIVTIRDSLIAKQKEGQKIYRLESGDPSFAIPAHVSEAIERAMADGNTHYTPGSGIQKLRQAVSEKLLAKNGFTVDPESVYITNGAMNALYVTARALIDAPHSLNVIVPDPTWTETADTITAAGGTPIRAKILFSKPDDYLFSSIQKIIKNTRFAMPVAISLNSPHNPTGIVLSEAEIRKIVKLADEYGIWVISDEAYEDVIYGDTKHFSPAATGYDKVISIYSMSKSYAMSGLRVGYMAVSGHHDESTVIQENIQRLLRLSINGVNSIAQHGAYAALTGPQDCIVQMRNTYLTRRNILFDSLAQSKYLQPFKPQGAFYIWCRIEENYVDYSPYMSCCKSESWHFTHELANNMGVGSAPGDVFGPAGDNFVRFAFSCDSKQIIEAGKILENM